jgi:hypothetical protein
MQLPVLDGLVGIDAVEVSFRQRHMDKDAFQAHDIDYVHDMFQTKLGFFYT